MVRVEDLMILSGKKILKVGAKTKVSHSGKLMGTLMAQKMDG